MDMGNDAYRDQSKFDEPWCKTGDYVLIERFAGARFRYNREEYRILNDDEIICVVDDPKKVSGI